MAGLISMYGTAVCAFRDLTSPQDRISLFKAYQEGDTGPAVELYLFFPLPNKLLQ